MHSYDVLMNICNMMLTRNMDDSDEIPKYKDDPYEGDLRNHQLSVQKTQITYSLQRIVLLITERHVILSRH